MIVDIYTDGESTTAIRHECLVQHHTHGLLRSDARLLVSIEADTWQEVMMLYHVCLGWEDDQDD